LAARFGPLIEGIKIVTNESATGRGELQFHSERSFQREEPLRGVALYAKEVHATGGATLFINCAVACQELPADLRSELLEADTVHRFDPRIRLGEAYGSSGVPEGGWHTIHPAVLPHPITGVPILYVSPWFTTAIAGRDDQSSRSLLSRLLEHLRDPAFLYRHEWQPGDLVLWDNLVLIHAREPYDESKRRILWKYEFGLPAGSGLAAPHAVRAG
jgi:alpha-ketoglutarate-dependent taurine dioxygenase